ncbi:hypothetical protein AB0E14_36060, partial [Streptomyces sp. NPDC047981]
MNRVTVFTLGGTISARGGDASRMTGTEVLAALGVPTGTAGPATPPPTPSATAGAPGAPGARRRRTRTSATTLVPASL